MAKLTLLEITQDILNDMDSDPVNSINDTEEALQVAQIVKTSYFEMMGSRNWPHLKTITQLDAVVDTNPAKLKLPELTKELETLNYNKRKVTDTKDKYNQVFYLAPWEFLEKLNNRDSSASTIDTVIDFGATKLFIRNDKQPEWWTSFDDEFIIFDSYDIAVEVSIQSSKTQALIYLSPVFTFSDTFIPDLPEEAFPALVAEAKSTSFVVLKQAANEKAEQKAQRSNAWLSRKAWRARGGIRRPDFGRLPKKETNPKLDKER